MIHECTQVQLLERNWKRRNKPPFLFFGENLDEFRLINFRIDKLEIICYTLVTVKKGEIIMNIDYKNLSTEKLLHYYEEISNLFYLPYVPMPDRKDFYTIRKNILEELLFRLEEEYH